MAIVEHKWLVNYFVTILIFVTLSLFGSGCGSGPSPDFSFIDQYLTTWDKFAQGASELVPRLKADTPEFHRQLASALQKGDTRAPSRMVFYAVVQVGGFVPATSSLGEAFRGYVGDSVPLFVAEKEGTRGYFAGDLYSWWEARKSEFPPFPLYEEWRQRDFARNVAIKMYESARKNPRQ